MLHCFGIFHTVLDKVFKADRYLANLCDFFERQVSYVSLTMSISAAVLIGYRICMSTGSEERGGEFKFGDVLTIRQTAKLKSPPIFPLYGKLVKLGLIAQLLLEKSDHVHCWCNVMYAS